MEFWMGQIMLVGFNYAPMNTLLCQGQILSINQNEALFALLGTTFGGDGVVNFALPDLRGRVPMGVGQVPSDLGSNVFLGQLGQQIPLQAQTGTGVAGVSLPILGLNYIICTVGIWPSRNN